MLRLPEGGGCVCKKLFESGSDRGGDGHDLLVSGEDKQPQH